MKRIVLVLAALLAGLSASARGGFLIKAGLSNSNMDLNREVSSVISEDVLSGAVFNNFTSYHAGIGYRTGTWGGFRLQPELLYNVRGTKIDDATNWQMGYLELPLNLQWGIDLILLRPFVQVAPFVGYGLTNSVSSTSEGAALGSVIAEANRFEYGLSIGGGIDILNSFQLGINYNWNYGHVANLTEYQEQVNNTQTGNARCLQLSVAYIF